MSDSERSYYCSQKFRMIKIDLESKTTLNCHAAVTHPVDIKWLSANPGKLFNNPISVAERQMMLLNQRNSSCEQNCWPAEDRGAISPRMYTNGVEKTHTQVITQPETIDITVGSDCNLTCSYCCKEYSSAWRRDIVNNGNYNVDSNRYNSTAKDHVLLKLSQVEINSSGHYNMLLNEVHAAAPTLKKLIITGGEPLLNNSFIDTLTQLPLSSAARVEIYTGLGVNGNRFEKLIKKLKLIPNLQLKVSAESTGLHLEFNRYGNKWSEWLDKINIIQQNKINMCFDATLSNLTVINFAEFYQKFSKDYKINIGFVNSPSMMAVHVLDSETKQQVIQSLSTLPNLVADQIRTSMQADPTKNNITQLKQFLVRFLKVRPSLSMDIYPESFVKWIGFDHVV